MRPKRALSPASISVFLLACGGSTANVGPAASGAGADDAEYEPAGDTAEATQAEEPSPCEDGTCFECGDGICPAGYYCDESGGAALCAWVPKCTPETGCGCVEKALPGCSCESRNGGAFVQCKD